jgi:hypothetical protein
VGLLAMIFVPGKVITRFGKDKMSKQDLIEFVELVQNDPKWKDQADMVLLKNRFALSQHLDESLIWHVLDDLRNIYLDTEDGDVPTHGDAVNLIDVVKLYLD